MFKYNTLSDLKDGTLTTPLRKDGVYIICQDEDGSESKHLIGDFDFAKKVEERDFVLSDDLTTEMEKDLEDEIIEFDYKNTLLATNIIAEAFISKKSITKKTGEVINNYGKNIKVNVETQIIRGNE